ncbi:MAG: two component transcriptional regulator, LuxR family [Solirubrobacterales bacterium]|jgi:DNA-binding NarL/FixJ family response regulator|nr:two component transcriptional regulator, LuxR family [Solirubrobacterales bacterium]
MQSASSPIAPAELRALVVDDHDVFRRGLVKLLREQGIDIVGEASGGRAAVRLTTELQPEIVLMDLSMPDLDGLEATRRIIESGSDAHVVVLTIADEDERVIEALIAGAVGYMRKDEPLESMVAAVRSAAAGDAVIPPRVAKEVLKRLRAHDESAASDGPTPQLSERELEVLRLIVEGRDNTAIAAALTISPHTVKNHVANILAKFGVANRLQASVQALRRGIVS